MGGGGTIGGRGTIGGEGHNGGGANMFLERGVLLEGSILEREIKWRIYGLNILQ